MLACHCGAASQDEEKDQGAGVGFLTANQSDDHRNRAHDQEDGEPGNLNEPYLGWRRRLGGIPRADFVAATDVDGGGELGELEDARSQDVRDVDRDVGNGGGKEVPEDLHGFLEIGVGGRKDGADANVPGGDHRVGVDEDEPLVVGFNEVKAVEGELHHFILDGDRALCCQKLADLRFLYLLVLNRLCLTL